ncbi:large conductance mechanosensitive channel protein [Sanguibacter keddieii DSM 10542]|uniref:Large-conductance mechanosensitive channel n=1 Tax=Sanguibacter keddieii (strain ATCC 51767 / DSM 10542 / NCFB 3025 / ST-74) TaxID=446469 RepID=D1BCH3_SANKS|nr:large conductance mechanosensitive channel protein MscL [Sanguibacter keddieii]ACZ22960.1 large conductance mechanosensitive channel protein [Sanguibacter keddieii DSM 10542]
MKNVLNGFKEFIMRGNAIDLAVGVIIGAAFSAVVAAIVENLFTPLIAAIFGEPDLSSVLSFTINGAAFSIGAVLNAVINFLFVAIALYFFVVLPLNHLSKLRKKGIIEEPEGPSEDVLILTQIRDLLLVQNGGPATGTASAPSTPDAPTTGPQAPKSPPAPPVA